MRQMRASESSLREVALQSVCHDAVKWFRDTNYIRIATRRGFNRIVRSNPTRVYIL